MLHNRRHLSCLAREGTCAYWSEKSPDDTEVAYFVLDRFLNRVKMVSGKQGFALHFAACCQSGDFVLNGPHFH